MNDGLKTWTVRLDDCAIVVTADNVELAVSMAFAQTGRIIANVEFIPLPTHHRYLRILTPTQVVKP